MRAPVGRLVFSAALLVVMAAGVVALLLGLRSTDTLRVEAVQEGDLIVSALKEEDLRRFAVATDGRIAEQETLLDRRFGRLRAVVIGPDGALYVSTANGKDDRILRVTRDG